MVTSRGARRVLAGRGQVTDGHRPTYSEKNHTTCPRCGSPKIIVLPANNPGSGQEWFRCGDCDHMWSQRRDRTEQGERRVPPKPPKDSGEGDGA